MPKVEVPDKKPDTNGELEIVDIVGPVCESSDVFAKARWFPRVQEGNLIAKTSLLSHTGPTISTISNSSFVSGFLSGISTSGIVTSVSTGQVL